MRTSIRAAVTTSAASGSVTAIRCTIGFQGGAARDANSTSVAPLTRARVSTAGRTAAQSRSARKRCDNAIGPPIIAIYATPLTMSCPWLCQDSPANPGPASSMWSRRSTPAATAAAPPTTTSHGPAPAASRLPAAAGRGRAATAGAGPAPSTGRGPATLAPSIWPSAVPNTMEPAPSATNPAIMICGSCASIAARPLSCTSATE